MRFHEPHHVGSWTAHRFGYSETSILQPDTIFTNISKTLAKWQNLVKLHLAVMAYVVLPLTGGSWLASTDY
jgi:hypothetical protein